MAGEGSILHALTSLKANKRKRNHIFTKDIDSSIYTDPIVFNKSNEEVCAKTAQRIRVLKNREDMRLRLILFIIFSLIITLLLVFIL